jgi:hypothetical protein
MYDRLSIPSIAVPANERGRSMSDDQRTDLSNDGEPYLPYSQFVNEILDDANAIGDTDFDLWAERQIARWQALDLPGEWIEARITGARLAYQVTKLMQSRGLTEAEQRQRLLQMLTHPSVKSILEQGQWQEKDYA